MEMGSFRDNEVKMKSPGWGPVYLVSLYEKRRIGRGRAHTQREDHMTGDGKMAAPRKMVCFKVPPLPHSVILMGCV